MQHLEFVRILAKEFGSDQAEYPYLYHAALIHGGQLDDQGMLVDISMSNAIQNV